MLGGFATTAVVAVIGSVGSDLSSARIEVANDERRDGRISTPYWSSTTRTVKGSGTDTFSADSAWQVFEGLRDREYVVTWPSPSGRPPPPESPPARLKPPVRTWWFYESGWPFRAFWGWQREDRLASGTTKTTSFVWWLPYLREQALYMPTHTWVPCLPLWPGLIANTLIYATMWWTLIATPFALRRALRRRRGQCPKCGYDCSASGDVCPECGSKSLRTA